MKPSRCDRCGERTAFLTKAMMAMARRVEWLCGECALKLEDEMAHAECVNCGRSRPHVYVCPDCDCCIDSCCDCH